MPHRDTIGVTGDRNYASNISPTPPKDYQLYLSEAQTGLPFEVEVYDHFQNYRAKFKNGMAKELTISDLINIHIVVQLRKKQKQ